MKIIRNLSQIKTKLPELALTIGNFDGVHLGHLEIINQVKKIAKEEKLKSATLTFEPHPINFFKPEKTKNFRITSLAQKLAIFKDQKIDYVIVLPFNKSFSEVSATNFVKDILAEKLNTKHLVIGYDFTFGKNREGNFKFLEKESEQYNFKLKEISPVKTNDRTSSSSAIRELISDGNIKEANHLLDKNFKISGLVNEGRKLASQLGFPTLNLKTKPHIIMPKFGVYESKTFIPHLNQTFNSITNFGVKPTVTNDLEAIFETHIPNFSQNIYSKKVIIEFIDFIRDEQKFNSLEELKNQIKQDLEKIGL